MNALHAIHAALVPGGWLVDTQPVSPHPRVEGGDGPLGTVDMREWARTIDAVDGRVLAVIDDGLFAPVDERPCVVVDEFDSGAEFVEVVGNWAGTLIPPAVTERSLSASPPVRVYQDVRLRLLRAEPTGPTPGPTAPAPTR